MTAGTWMGVAVPALGEPFDTGNGHQERLVPCEQLWEDNFGGRTFTPTQNIPVAIALLLAYQSQA